MINTANIFYANRKTIGDIASREKCDIDVACHKFIFENKLDPNAHRQALDDFLKYTREEGPGKYKEIFG